jgi:site-specific DNA-methyltransferase (adenine-specific)
MELWHGDCLELMPMIPDKSIDAIICDLPYGTTACKWDLVIPFEPLWAQYKRIIKDNAAVVLFGSQPFTSALVMSNIKMFKYCLVWDKRNATGHLNAKAKPLKQHDDIIIFSDGSATSTSKTMTYNPQGIKSCRIIKLNYETDSTGHRKCREKGKPWIQEQTGYPKSIIVFPYDNNKLHPTQKPVALIEYLIKTYTNECETVLDNCMGSGTCGVACVNTNRDFIGIEKDDKYFEIAKNRIETVQGQFKQQRMFG